MLFPEIILSPVSPRETFPVKIKVSRNRHNASSKIVNWKVHAVSLDIWHPGVVPIKHKWGGCLIYISNIFKLEFPMFLSQSNFW